MELCAGTDATDPFEDQQHTRAAERQLEKLVIGKLPEGEGKRGSGTAFGVHGDGSTAQSSKPATVGSPLLFLVPVILILVLLYLNFR